MTSGPERGRGFPLGLRGGRKWSCRFPIPMQPSPDGGQLSVRTSAIGGFDDGRGMEDQLAPPSWVSSLRGLL
jgi:hypothetical protein